MTRHKKRTRQRIQHRTRQRIFESLESRTMLAGDGFFGDKLPAENGGGIAPRIVGGGEAAPGAWPWMVSLQDFGYHFCGGTLVAPDAIVTAAHCVEGTSASSLNVVIGRHDLTSSAGKTHAVDEIILHPDYDPYANDADIAILLLRTASDQTPLDILHEDQADLAAPGVISTVIGWGALREGGQGPDELFEVDVPIVSNEEANAPLAYAGAITPTMLAAGEATGGKDSCQGDSGGPLMVQDDADTFYLAGIVSWGEGCARAGKPGIYTRVTSFADWIDENTRVSPRGSVNFVQERYVAGQTAEIRLSDADLAGQESVVVTVETASGDSETITLNEIRPGRFFASFKLSETESVSGNQVVDVLGAPSVEVTYADSDDGTGKGAIVTDRTRIVTDDHGSTPNRATEVTLPALVAGELELDGDEDWFRFAVDNEHAYAIEVILDGSLNDSVIDLYTDDGTTFVDSDDDSGPSFASSLVWHPTHPGFGYVAVTGYGSNVGSYHVRIEAMDPVDDDHGANQLTATPIGLETAVRGNIELPTDVDWFSFEAEAESTYRIETRLLGLSDSVIRLLEVDPDGTHELAYNDDSGGGLESLLVWQAQESGTYFIEVSSYDIQTGTYDLLVSRAAAIQDDHGSSRQTATEIDVPGTTDGDIELFGDQDWFSFNAEEGTSYQFMTHLSTLDDSVLSLMDSQGRELLVNDDDPTGSLNSRIDWTAPASGTYYLVVTAFDNSQVGKYQLDVTTSNGVITDDHGDDAEHATSLDLPTVLNAELGTQGDEDWFQWTAKAGVYYSIRTTLSSLVDSYLLVFDSDGVSVLAENDDFGNSLASGLVWEAPRSDTFYAVVRGYNASDLGSYELALSVPYGDVNLDGVFNSTDLVEVFQRGEYEDEIANNSTWSEGDWNGDGEFSTADLVAAFQQGHYVTSSRPSASRAELGAAVDALFRDSTDEKFGHRFV